ncbi:retrotransposon protein, putative, ty1-copia subclass [Tanacetum coccineum]
MFKNKVENQLGKTIKALRSYRGGEYISQEFKDYLKACGIVQQLTPPYTPQHNGVSERRNRTLLDMVRSMMNLTTLPLSFWDYGLEFAARILNMVPTNKVDKTSYELWFRKVPNLSYLKETMGYYFYFLPENKIVVVRYVEFFEKNLLSQEVSGRVGGLKEIQDEDTSPSEITSEIPMEVEGFEPPQEEEAPVRRSERPHRAPNRLCLNVEVKEHSLGDLNEPANYKAAMLDPKSNKWLDAMNAEMILIAIAAFYDYEIWKMDFKTAFLNGYLDEDICMIIAIAMWIETDRDDTKSQTGYVFILNGGAVDWKSSKQSITAMSATEAEYIAASEAAMEVV